MTETRRCSVHLPEFKVKVGLEAVRGVKTIKEIAQDYGVQPVQGNRPLELRALEVEVYSGVNTGLR